MLGSLGSLRSLSGSEATAGKLTKVIWEVCDMKAVDRLCFLMIFSNKTHLAEWRWLCTQALLSVVPPFFFPVIYAFYAFLSRQYSHLRWLRHHANLAPRVTVPFWEHCTASRRQECHDYLAYTEAQLMAWVNGRVDRTSWCGMLLSCSFFCDKSWEEGLDGDWPWERERERSEKLVAFLWNFNYKIIHRDVVSLGIKHDILDQREREKNTESCFGIQENIDKFREIFKGPWMGLWLMKDIYCLWRYHFYP